MVSGSDTMVSENEERKKSEKQRQKKMQISGLRHFGGNAWVIAGGLI